MLRPCIFVSAVSRELGDVRRMVADTLRRLGYDTVTQGDFPTGYGELRRWLEQQIDACEGLVQLVGDAYGAEPPASDDPKRPWPDPDFGRISYTQYELLYAQRRGRRTWVIEVGPDCTREAPERLDLPRDLAEALAKDPNTPIDEAAREHQAERRALQQTYRDRLRAGDHLRHKASTDERLQNLILNLKDELGALRRRENLRLLWLGLALAAVLAVLVVLGVGGWWAYQALSEKTDTISEKADALSDLSVERIRSHLSNAVDTRYREDLKTVEQSDDWQQRERLRKAAAAQRAAQLARIDELAISFVAIEHWGQADQVFAEMTRILDEQGVDQALAYIESKSHDLLAEVDQINERARRHARNKLQPLLISAGLYQTKGNVDAAHALYADILARAPDWPEAIYQAMRFHRELGDRAWLHGELSKAAAEFERAFAHVQQLTEIDPSNPQWQHELSVSHVKLGDVTLTQGHLKEATAAYLEALAIDQRLVALEADNTEWQRNLSVSLDRLGDVAVAQGRHEEAATVYREALVISEHLAVLAPDNTNWQRDLSVSHAKLGDVAVAQGHLEEASLAYREALAIDKRLVALEPDNTQWQRELSVSYTNLGDLAANQDRLEEAAAAYREALAIDKRLAALDPDNTQWQRDLAISHMRLGSIADERGQDEELRAHWTRTVAIFDDMLKRGLYVTAQDLAGLEPIRERLAALAE